PDRDLARELGRTVESVRQKRRKMRIPGSERPLQRPWTESDDALLGKWPDTVLAEKLNRTPESVAARRRSRGIAPAQVLSNGKVGMRDGQPDPSSAAPLSKP